MEIFRRGVQYIFGKTDDQLHKTTWKKTIPVTGEEKETREELTIEDLIKKMEDGVEVTSEEFWRRRGLLFDEFSKALRTGDRVRAGKLFIQRLKLKNVYLAADRRRRNQEKKIQEEADKIKKEAWKIKAETEALSQKTDADQQVLETTEFVKNMTEEILEQKKRLSKKNVGLERTGNHKMDNTSGKETYRDIQIHIRSITGLVQEKMQNLSEEVRKRLELFMSAFWKLLAGIWKLLFIVLMLDELEKLLASLLLGDIYTSSRKRRLKYGFKMAAMLALWLSHDVESNPGPSFDRTPLEKIIRQLSEVLRYHLPVGGSLWSESVAEAAYAAGYSPDFKWNNPSGPNKDSVSKLTARAAELGRLLSSMDCLPAEFAPFVFTLDQNEALEHLRIHYMFEALKIAVDNLLHAESFTDRQIMLFVQLIGRMKKKLADVQQQRSHPQAAVVGEDIQNLPSPDFGKLADINIACNFIHQQSTSAYVDMSLTTALVPKGVAVSSDIAKVDDSGMIPSCLVTDTEIADELTTQDQNLQSIIDSSSDELIQTVDLSEGCFDELLMYLDGQEQQTFDNVDEHGLNAAKSTSLTELETSEVHGVQQDLLQTETKISGNGNESIQKKVNQEHRNTEVDLCTGISQSMPTNQHSLADSSNSLDQEEDVRISAMTMSQNYVNIASEDLRKTQLTADSSISETRSDSKIGNDRNTCEMENTIASISVNGMGKNAKEDMEEKEPVFSNKDIDTVENYMESQQKKTKMTSVTTYTEDSQNQPGIATQTIEGTNTCNDILFDLTTDSMDGTLRCQAGGIQTSSTEVEHQERNLLVNLKASLLKNVETIDNRLRNIETVLTAPNQQNQMERESIEEIQQGTDGETEQEKTVGGLSQSEPPLISRKRKRRYSVRRAKKPK